ncbi:uncharacterized protein LOC129566788 [Sitodiplosis mosellana]|uniref:uncharacterized protein LOC129566788 n=1 Tax=Sitodiplosis mosellana TaxID=263140 RepID=UPI0024453179|nr:uncharacterized protein LOC129566788 [Sitodiplosis mosellana]
MKQLVLICAVISAAMLVNGSPSEQEYDGLLAIEFSGENNSSITEEQIKCLRAGKKQVIESHPSLKPWFDDIAKTSKFLAKYVDRCRAIHNSFVKKICFKTLGFITSTQRRRLFGKLNEEQKTVVQEIKQVYEECLKPEPTTTTAATTTTTAATTTTTAETTTTTAATTTTTATLSDTFIELKPFDFPQSDNQ